MLRRSSRRITLPSENASRLRLSFCQDGMMLESVDAVITFYRNQRESLEKRNYDHSGIVSTRIIPLTADDALINVAYRRYKKDGSLLEEGAAFYPVSKSSGDWKLRGAVAQEPKYFGKVYDGKR